MAWPYVAQKRRFAALECKLIPSNASDSTSFSDARLDAKVRSAREHVEMPQCVLSCSVLKDLFR